MEYYDNYMSGISLIYTSRVLYVRVRKTPKRRRLKMHFRSKTAIYVRFQTQGDSNTESSDLNSDKTAN